MGGQDDGSVPDAGRRSASGRRRLLLVLVLAGAGAVLVVALVLGVAIRPASVAAEPRLTTPTGTARSTAPSAPPTSAVPSPTVEADAPAAADLDAVAATLTAPLALTSPATWDQWLPEGKPYPGADTADDMSTCPRLSDRLGAALGTKMSYWVGTIPGGPYGCQWATVPLYSGPNAPNYPYLASVGFASDGSTTEQVAGSFYHHQGRLCPDVAVPSVGEGAHLVRCEELDGISYALVLPDTRTAGVWTLIASARSDAAHPATDVLRPVIEGAAAAFG
jgi:hypothetical protein